MIVCFIITGSMNQMIDERPVIVPALTQNILEHDFQITFGPSCSDIFFFWLTVNLQISSTLHHVIIIVCYSSSHYVRFSG